MLHQNLLKRLVGCLLSALAASALCACVGKGTGEPSNDAAAQVNEATEIVVAAAANLTDAFGEMGQSFTSQTGIRVTYSFGASADLGKQIENGAPFDVFASADVKTVEELERGKLLTEGTRAVYARGKLVLWLPSDTRAAINRLEDLTREDVRAIALAKPDIAPYGRAAVEALRALKIWDAVEEKVVYGQNVAQAKQFAVTGNADAAFLPRSLIRRGEGRTFEVDESLYGVINQSIGVVRVSGKQEASLRFVEFVLSDAGQEILERYGYEKGLDAR